MTEPTPSGKVCNFDYLNELANGNEKFVKDMISLFLNEIPEEISNLERGIQGGNFDLVKQAAHKLRSTIPFVGIDKYIEKEIQEMEKLAVAGSGMETIRTHFVKVRKVCEQAYQELKG